MKHHSTNGSLLVKSTFSILIFFLLFNIYGYAQITDFTSDQGVTITSNTSGGDDNAKFIEASPGWKTSLTVTSGSTSIELAFGGDANATDGYDTGLDIAAAPPGMTYYAYFETPQFPNYLSTDIRAWISPYQANIDWTLKIVNATGKTSTLTWVSANLPAEGKFTLEGADNPVDMRVQSTITFSGDKTLTIKYRWVAQESITVTAPNGGEKWTIGNTQNITWTSSNFTAPVKIEYSTDAGATWLTPPIASSTPNDGTHPWTIPNTPSTNCKVRISDAADGIPSDVSDNVFTIAAPASGWKTPITVTSGTTTFDLGFGGDPTATDGYDAGLDAAAAPPGMTYYAYFEILQFPNYLSTDIRGWISPYQTNIDWTLKIVNATGKTSTITWNSANLPAQGTFTLEGTTSPVNMRTQNTVTFSGDKTLVIKYRWAPSESITVTAPNGGEKWAIGSTQNITWTSNNFTAPVKIEYSTDAGVTWLTPPIASSTPNDGAHPWTIPNTPSTNCKVRISDAADGDPFDTSDNVFTIGSIVDVWPPADTVGAPNSIVNIPIYIRDATNKGIFSASLTINTQTNVLTPLSATTQGSIAQTWGAPTVSISGGDIKISMAGTSALVGTGKQILVYIRYQVGATATMTTPITLSEVLFNEGQPVANIINGKFTITNIFLVSGNIKYYSNLRSVAQASVSITGPTVKTANTDTSGSYKFTDLLGGNYLLKPAKVKDVRNAISPYDASLILRYSVNTISLTPYQKIAADVSGNGQVTSFDASFILRYYVGTITQFPVGKDWKFVPKNFTITETNWTTAPDSLEYKPLNSDLYNQDFVGIIFGDVSGNWPSTTASLTSGIVTTEIAPCQRIGEGKWLMPVVITFLEPAFSGSFRLNFKNPDLKFVSGSVVNPASDFLLESHCLLNQAHFDFASARTLTNEQLTINITLESTKPMSPNGADLEIVEVIIDDKLITVTNVDPASDIQMPHAWQLCQNYPNPFNAITSIAYQVPQTAHVRIELFNTLGQRLCTLADEDKNPGIYHINWDGKDELGKSMGSGIYIYRMQAGDFIAIKKMVLVR